MKIIMTPISRSLQISTRFSIKAMNNKSFTIKQFFTGVFLVLLCMPVVAQIKIGIVSTQFVLEQKFKLMEQAARQKDVSFDWTQVDREGEAGVKRVLDKADLVFVDAPRKDDITLVERILTEIKGIQQQRILNINVMNPPDRIRPANIPPDIAQTLFEYYAGGTPVNHQHMFDYLKAYLTSGDLSSVTKPVPLPDGGIYHPGFERMIFDSLADYRFWWEKRSSKPWSAPVIAMEIPSSYISDGQLRMLDETISAIEKAKGIPLVFYRSSPANPVARAPRQDGANRPVGASRPVQAPTGNGFPNPKAVEAVAVDEPLLMQDGKLVANVVLVNTFLGINPDARKAWHQAMGIPVINIINYRTGTRADYEQDNAGVSSFSLPFALTNAEYIGLQDPIVLCTNESGELVPIAEQMDLLIGKAINLAKLQTLPPAEKKVALLFWNYPPGEKNQGASNMNVPRSIELLTQRLREEGYAFDNVSEAQIIEAVATMLRPRYRRGEINALMATPHWDFLPLSDYKKWFSTLPKAIREQIETHWGAPEKSQWLADKDGGRGFVIPRMKLGNLVVMPQPSRGEMAFDEDEAKLFHDTKMPLNHSYMATYLWIREGMAADAIVHFGTHGSQEWTPGKERGLWAYDHPIILVGNVPVVYPYIVDNIGEATHVKRRGRGVIVSHQTAAFAPAGLSDDFVAINDMIREIREYQFIDQSPVKKKIQGRIIDQVVKMNIHKDMSWAVADLEREFDDFSRDLEDYLEDLATAMQPLGLHTLGKEAETDHQISNIMQMLGQPLYDLLGVDPKKVFREDYKQLQSTQPYRFVDDYIFSGKPLNEITDPRLRAQAERGLQYRDDLMAHHEIEAVIKGLSSRWIDPSYGGDPIRNPDALPTGRNVYGFDPSRVPTPSAYAAGKEAIEGLILTYQATHDGEFPKKLTFTVWSNETMRHLGMLEAQIMYAMGVKPVWDAGGRVIGMEVIPQQELGRPRIDTVISLTGLYRDQFPNVMERLNEAIVMLANLNESDDVNFIRANTARIKAQLLKEGVAPDLAEEFALTRIFGTESGDYGTRLPDATLASDQWDENDGKLANLYLSRMSWAYGPNSANWSRKLEDGNGRELNVYAEQLKGTSAAIFSRSSNLRGLLDTDHPFEYLGGISLAVQHLDGKAPQLYISNMRDPYQTKLETAEKFMAKELRSVYQHPNWMAEMQKEGYSGTLAMLDAINNFWGWQVMDRNVVRDDQWQEFHETYIKDRYELGMREWFEQSNPTALAQIAERMIEAIRKEYWQADEQTKKELVQVYQDFADRYDVHTSNETFKAYVQELAQGYGISPLPVGEGGQTAQSDISPSQTVQVQGQQLEKVEMAEPLEFDYLKLAYLLPLLLSFIAGAAVQLGARKKALPLLSS